VNRNEIYETLADGLEAALQDVPESYTRSSYYLAEELMDYLKDNGIVITLTVKEEA
jgi:hypothetical protein